MQLSYIPRIELVPQRVLDLFREQLCKVSLDADVNNSMDKLIQSVKNTLREKYSAILRLDIQESDAVETFLFYIVDHDSVIRIQAAKIHAILVC